MNTASRKILRSQRFRGVTLYLFRPYPFHMIQHIIEPIVELFREFSASILYQLRRLRTSGKQREALPQSYNQYRKYKTTYGVAPGDIAFIEEGESVILSIKGPPTIGAKVEYYDLNRERKYKTGLVNLFKE